MMHRFFQPKTNLRSNENNDMGNNYRKRSYSRSKSSSHVVPSSMINIPENKDNAHIVRIRLVFIRIGKKRKHFLFLFNQLIN